MIDEIRRLCALVRAELVEAARRIEQQSGLILRARLRARRWRRRWRSLRRRWHNTQAPTGGYCDWIAQESKYGRLYWRCRYCGASTLRPSTWREQKRWGQRCPDAPEKEAARANH